MLFDLRQLKYGIKRDIQDIAPVLARALLCMLATYAHTHLLLSPIGNRLESELLRTWFQTRGDRDVPDSVAIVRLDKLAFESAGLSPGEMFPRARLAEGVGKMARAGAKLIVLDLVPQRTRDEHGDRQLARVLEDSPTVIGRYSERLTDVDPSGISRSTVVTSDPIPLFEASADSVISIAVRTTNGRVEHIRLLDTEQQRGQRVPLLTPLRTFVSETINEPSDRDFINFYGGPSTLPSISFSRLLDGSSGNDEFFRDRVVFVGIASPTGIGFNEEKDSFPTSFSSHSMFGVEIHATIAANLIDGSWIRRLTAWTEVVLMAAITFISTYIILSSAIFTSFLAALAIWFLWTSLSFNLFALSCWFVPGAAFICFILPPVLLGRVSVIGYRSLHKLKALFPREHHE